ncbi:MAG: acetolactate synthase small subunit [Candidatus Omnitrophica bacterium]|nr:acetolactate synthase small subunit [Candidatus Omnitrophota bacterium]
MKHTISVFVENKFGVLARIAGLFSARGYNIDSLAVGETQDPTISRMTIVVNAADERVLEQIKKQLNKLIDVISVNDFTKKKYFDRELILVKIDYSRQVRQRVEQLVKKFSLKLLEHNNETAVIEAVVDQHAIKDLLEGLKQIGIKELVRTGRIAIEP